MNQFEAVREPYELLERGVNSFDASAHDGSVLGSWHADIYLPWQSLQSDFFSVSIFGGIDTTARTKVIALLERAWETIPDDEFTATYREHMRDGNLEILTIPTEILEIENDLDRDEGDLW